MNEPFDLILLAIGDLIQQGVTQIDYSVAGTLLALSTFVLLTVRLSYLSFRIKKVRTRSKASRLCSSRTASRSTRTSRASGWPSTRCSEARMQQLTSLKDIHWAILETNGSLSIIPNN
jgi:uncharacterized membrane protein YcaP (DUF421 family)